MPDLFLTTDYAELLAHPGVDIVSVFTPDALHADHVVAAFEAGKDVTCTKPLTVSLADARRILDSRAQHRKAPAGGPEHPVLRIVPTPA